MCSTIRRYQRASARWESSAIEANAGQAEQQLRRAAADDNGAAVERQVQRGWLHERVYYGERGASCPEGLSNSAARSASKGLVKPLLALRAAKTDFLPKENVHRPLPAITVI